MVKGTLAQDYDGVTCPSIRSQRTYRLTVERDEPFPSRSKFIDSVERDVVD